MCLTRLDASTDRWPSVGMWECTVEMNHRQQWYYAEATLQTNYVTIQSKDDDTCMDYHISLDVVYSEICCHSGQNQLWYYEIVSQQIKNVYNGYCLDVDQDANVVASAQCTDSDSQKWTVSGDEIKNINGKCSLARIVQSFLCFSNHKSKSIWKNVLYFLPTLSQRLNDVLSRVSLRENAKVQLYKMIWIWKKR